MKVALTFDDGPSQWTEPILDLLAEHDAKATFFVVGANIPGRVHILDRIHADGHQIGNHTTNHPDLSMLYIDEVKDELDETSLMIAAVTDEAPRIWRAPYLRRPQYHPAGMRHIGCDVIPQDWCEPDPDVIADRVIRGLAGGEVVLLHDGRPPGQVPRNQGGSLDDRTATIEAVGRVLGRIDRTSVEFVTVNGLHD